MDRIHKARGNLVLGQPFFGVLAMGMHLVERPTIKTMETDGESIFFNPDFVDRIDFDQVVGVLGHEMLHVANFHNTRRGSRDAKLWNEACDYAINPMLAKAGLHLPKGCLLDMRFDGMSAEEIYRVLDQERKGNPEQPDQDGDNDPGGSGGVLDAPAPTPERMAEAESNTRVKVLQAVAAARAAGKLPSSFEKVAIQARENKVNWREEAHRFAVTLQRADHSWTPPNRRYVHQGLYLSSIRSEQVGPIVFAVDISGSITEADRSAFSAEMDAVVRVLNPVSVHVVYCDDRIRLVEQFDLSSGDPLEVKGLSGGGTDFIPPFAWVEQEGLDPAGLIYLTDLCCSSFPLDPGYPCLWVSTFRTDAPFGDVIKMEV